MPWLLRESFFYNHLNAPRPCTRTRRHATDGPRLLALALLSSVCGRIRRIWEPSCSTSHGRIARASPDRAPAWSGRSTSIKEGRRSDLLSPHHRRRCFPEHFRWRFGALPERPGHRTETKIKIGHSPEAIRWGVPVLFGWSWLVWLDHAESKCAKPLRGARCGKSTIRLVRTHT